MKIYKKAGFLERFIAYLIDIIIVLQVIFVFKSLLSINFDRLLIILLFIVYNTFFLSTQSTTVGKKILRIKVVDENYNVLTFRKALIRELSKIFSELIYYIGFLWVLIDKKKQAWHDKIAKTFSVKINKEGNLIPIETEENVSLSRKIFFVLICFIQLLLTLIPLGFLLIYPVQIKGKAMEPSYKNGQYYITNKIIYKLKKPKKGDVIIFSSPKNPNIKYIKRIIGLPGDEVRIYQGKVYINNTLLNEDYLQPNTTTKTWESGFIKEGISVTVPNDQYLVLNDNRSYRSDSREWGFVREKDIIGKVWFCFYGCF